MSTEIWSEIIAEYKAARHCLWCPKGSQNCSRNEADGYIISDEHITLLRLAP